MSKPIIADDTRAKAAVQSYINKIKNANKRRYAQAFWYAIIDESLGMGSNYPDTTAYELKYMTIQAVQMRIRETIEQNRTEW